MVTENLARAFASTRSVLEGLKDPDLDASTPCASWKVRDLIDHIVAGANWFGATAETGDGTVEPVAPAWNEANVVEVFDAAASRAVAAFGAPGAQEKMMKLPFGEFPGAAFMGLATSDTFTHGWDLAKATGQSTDLDPELAEGLLANGQIPDHFRGDEPMPFAPQQEAPPNATAADRYAAYLGRKV